MNLYKRMYIFSCNIVNVCVHVCLCVRAHTYTLIHAYIYSRTRIHTCKMS